MQPILFHIGSFEVHSYFILMYGGFLAGLALAKRCTTLLGGAAVGRTGLPIVKHHVSEAAWTSLVYFVLGGRILYLAFNPNNVLHNPAEWVRVWNGGFSLIGGVVGVTVFLIHYCRKRGLAPAALADIFAPGAALACAIGRLGCLLGGCCYGAPCSLPWGVRFLIHGSNRIWTPLSHPTQLYETAADLTILALMFAFRPHARKSGETAIVGLFFYSIGRFVIEEFRKGVTSPIAAAGLTGTQCLCLIMLILSMVAFYRFRSIPDFGDTTMSDKQTC